MESQKTRAGDHSHNKGPRDLILKPLRHSSAGRGRQPPHRSAGPPSSLSLLLRGGILWSSNALAQN